jgi:carbon-monoxide dehydrogenase medium subunit
MKPPPFAYARPTSLDEALGILAGSEAALPLAGGQSLVPMLNMRLVRPDTIVDLSRVPALNAIEAVPSSVTAGARVTHHDLAGHPRLAAIAALPRAVSEIGFQAIRHRGTLGGSLAHADPAAELPTLLLAVDAMVTLTSASGGRDLPLDDFLVGYYSTARRPDELITRVQIPTPDDLRSGFAEFSRRPGDFALALCAAAVWGDGPDRTARVVVGGLDVRPRRLPALETALADGDGAGASELVTTDLLAQATSPSSDIHGSADYRLHVGAEMVRRAIGQLEEAA